MRQITKQATSALRDGHTFKLANTAVTSFDGRHCMFLHGHIIAARRHDVPAISLSLCGWNTPTTRERLNGIAQAYGLPVRFCQRNHAAWVREIDTGREYEIDPSDVLTFEY